MTGRRIFVLCVLVGVSACDETGQRGTFVAHLFDTRVQCNEAQDVCHDASNEQAKPERLHGVAFVSHLASSDGVGTYLYLEVARADGTIGVLEVDVPGAGSARVNYREITRGGGRETFKAHTVTGTIEVPPPECRCDDGRFELQLLDPGPDRVAGTSDDQTRRLSRSQFSRSGNYCRSSRLPSIAQVQGIRVIRLGCPAKRPVGGTYPKQAYYSEPVEVGCGVEDDGYEDYDDGGCGGDDDYDDYDDYAYDDDNSGCEGDGSDDSSGGCEGDGSGSYDDSDGSDCEGGGCEGDANAARSTARPRRIRPLGTLPYVLVALLITHNRRRRHRRRRRDKTAVA